MSDWGQQWNEAQAPREMRRKLLVLRVESETLAPLSEPGGGANLDMPALDDLYNEEWTVVSHTLAPSSTRDYWTLSVLLEHRYARR